MSDDVAVTEFALAAVSEALGVQLQLDDDRPDNVDRTNKAVDFIARDGDRIVAIEHTQIGAFNEQERLDAQMRRRLGPLCDELQNLLPDDSTFMLSISAHDAPIVRTSDLDPLRRWIVEAAPTLKDPPRHHATRSYTDIPCTLYRWPPQDGHVRLELRIGVETGGPVETLRRERLRRAANEKLPKLEDARALHGATDTLLVLDSPDHQLSNAWDIAAALKHAVAGLPLADHVVLVEDGVVSVLRLNGEWLDNIRPNLP